MHIDYNRDDLLPKIQVWVYLGAAGLVALSLYDQFQRGFYPLVLSNALAIPAFLFAATYIHINQHLARYQYVNYGLVIFLSALGLWQLSSYPKLMTYYLYVMPLFSFFALPIRSALLGNSLILCALCLILWSTQDLVLAIRTSLHYLLLCIAAWSFASLIVMKHESLRRLTLTDHFSGAYNQRHFSDILGREIERSHSSGKPVSLVALLIDDYSLLQDMYGNQVTNEVLPKMVDSIQALIRTEDEIFRLEPDLFVLLLPNCSDEHANVLMERIHTGLKEQEWPTINQLALVMEAMAIRVGENEQEAQSRLIARLKKEQLTRLQMTSFSPLMTID